MTTTTELRASVLSALTAAERCKIFNDAVANHSLPIKQVAKFASADAAVKRIEKLIGEYGLRLAQVNDEWALTQDEQPAADEAPEAPEGQDEQPAADEAPADEAPSGEDVPVEQGMQEAVKADGERRAEDAAQKPLRDQIEEAAAKRKAEQKTKKSATKGGKKGPAPTHSDDAKITILTEDKKNPKREGTAAHARFALYRDGMTVAEFIKAGGTRADLAWDSAASRGLVKIG